MNKFVETSGVALAGLATSILTAVIVTAVNVWTGFNLFTFSAWVVLPAGAGLCGFAAASGYYLAAKYLHQRPTKILLLQMVVIAGLTQFLIYFLEYKTLYIDGKHIADFVPFFQYLDITLTTAHMKIGRALQSDTGEVGSFGYWLAFFEFIGFLLGGVVVFAYLQAIPTCENCAKYMRSAITKKDGFSSNDEFAAYYDNVYSYPVDSSDFYHHVNTRHALTAKQKQGDIHLETTVFECQSCFGQAIEEKVSVFNGRELKEVNKLKRYITMPSGIDVRPAFR